MVSTPEKDISSGVRYESNSRRPVPLTSPDDIFRSVPDMNMSNWMVTGGAGFIGSNFILSCRADKRARIFNLDKLSATGNLANIDGLREDQDHIFIRGDIRNRILVQRILHEYMPDTIIHFAAECSTDHSFLSPEAFIQTNVLGTFSLLEETRQYWENLEKDKQSRFRFLHISSPEVYGPLTSGENPRSESSPYNPSGIYAASKASCDHLARAYQKTYGLPVLISNCSGVFGPYQFPYEPVPRIILNALEGKEITLIGNGSARCDWIHVDDLSRALRVIIERGRPGDTYHVSAANECSDREMVYLLCDILDSCAPESPYRPHRSLIEIPGENIALRSRYVLDESKITRELGWQPEETLESGLRKAVQWYLGNSWWVNAVRSGEYRSWTDRPRLERKTGTD